MTTSNKPPRYSDAKRAEFARAVVDIDSLLTLRHAARELVFFPRKIARSQLAGGQKSVFRGRGMDFEEVRHYQAGDDVRSIDWRVTARTRSPHTKIFREERERPVFIVTDMRRSMLFGSQQLKAETAVRIATALGWAAVNANDRVGSMAFGPQTQMEIKPRRSHHNVLKMIHSLQDLCGEMLTVNENQYTSNQIVEQIRRIAHPGSAIFIISDFHDIQELAEGEKPYQENLYELTQHCDVTLCQVYDLLEKQLPPPGYYPVLDNGQRTLLNTTNTDLQALCRKQFEQRAAHLHYLGNKLGLGFLTFDTSGNEIGQLVNAYGKRRRRKT